MRPKLDTILKILFGLFILFILFFKIGLHKLYSTFASSNLIYILPIILVSIATILLTALAIKIIFSPFTENLSFWWTLKYFCYSLLIGIFFPANIGQFLMIYFFKEKIKVGSAAAIFLLYKIEILFLAAILSLCGFFLLLDQKNALKLAGIVALAGIIIVIFFFTPYGIRLWKLLLGKYAQIFSGFSSTINTYFKQHKLTLLLSFLVILATWLLIALNISLAFLAFNIKFSFFKILLINSMVMILASIPLSLSGLGIREGSAVFLYSILGLNSASVLSSYLLLTFINSFFQPFIIYIFMVWKGEKFVFDTNLITHLSADRQEFLPHKTDKNEQRDKNHL